MGKSCDKARVCNDQESWNLVINRSRAERKGLYGSEGKESGSRFGSSEDIRFSSWLEAPKQDSRIFYCCAGSQGRFGDAKHFTSQ